MSPGSFRTASAAVLAGAALLASCRSATRPAMQPEPMVGDGTLAVRVVYPPVEAVVGPVDSLFLLGSTGTGTAHLTVNDQPVEVSPFGTWLAWLPLPPEDTVARFVLLASTTRDTQRVEYRVRHQPRFRPPADTSLLWIDTTSFYPTGSVWWPADEPLDVGVRAAPGAAVALLLPDGRRIPLDASAAYAPVPEAVRDFDWVAPARRRELGSRYRGVLHGVSFGGLPDDFLGRPAVDSAASLPPAGPSAATGPLLEVTRGTDTLRTSWPLRLALADPVGAWVVVDGDPGRAAPARAAPGASYHWFLPAGTETTAIGRINGDVRLRLAMGQEAWVALRDVTPAGTAGRRPAVLQSITTRHAGRSEVIRVPVGRKVPVQVEEESRRLILHLYGAVGDIDWTRYGTEDGVAMGRSLVDAIAWRQTATDQVEISVTLRGPWWGYRTRWDADDLLLEIRRPPAIDRTHPLRGLRVVVDPGHPPAGTTGPSGWTEAEANLAVGRRVRELLQHEGSAVFLTREGPDPLGLVERTRFADSVDADLLVSIHNNALPDGVNPFVNSGSSTFYNHLPSLPLARAVQAALVRRLGLRDLGVARGDLALVRPTGMPAILTEGVHLILPDQEALLRTPAGQEAYAQAVVDGLRGFLRGVARGEP